MGIHIFHQCPYRHHCSPIYAAHFHSTRVWVRRQTYVMFLNMHYFQGVCNRTINPTAQNAVHGHGSYYYKVSYDLEWIVVSRR